MGNENLKSPKKYDILRSQSKLNAMFNIIGKTEERNADANQTTLANMQEYIIAFQKKNGRSPSYRQVQKAMNMSSLNLVQRYVLALERDGRIGRTRLGSIDMLPKLRPSGVAITPIVGSIACGQPVDAV